MPYEVVAKSDEPNAWLLPVNPGLPEIGPFKLDDGRDIYQLIANIPPHSRVAFWRSTLDNL